IRTGFRLGRAFAQLRAQPGGCHGVDLAERDESSVPRAGVPLRCAPVLPHDRDGRADQDQHAEADHRCQVHAISFDVVCAADHTAYPMALAGATRWTSPPTGLRTVITQALSRRSASTICARWRAGTLQKRHTPL